jgi:hypothetical protein
MALGWVYYDGQIYNQYLGKRVPGYLLDKYIAKSHIDKNLQMFSINLYTTVG